MTRRGLTLLTTVAASVVLLLIAATAAVPYASLRPGPVSDTLGDAGNGVPLIQITGTQTFPTTGKLELTTVSYVKDLRVLQALYDYVQDGRAVVPIEVVEPKGQTSKEIEDKNTQEMLDSQTSAITVALGKLDLLQVAVAEVTDGGPSVGKLQPGDVITAVDGTPVTSPTEVGQQITKRAIGEPVRIGVLRDSSPQEVTITTVASPPDAGPSRPLVGITTKPEPKNGISVTINLEQVGGPSAGLMFSLGIYDRLTQADIAGGKVVAGTGTIDADGVVGPIGGIQQKLRGARGTGATVFLTPAENCSEAVPATPKGLRLVKVTGFDDALTSLTALREGRLDALPTC